LKTGVNIRKEIVRFVIAGALATATDFCIYFLLIHFLPFSISKGISFTCGGIVGYVLSKYWTFKQNQQSYLEARRYVLINFLALGVNVLTNQSILNVWPDAVYLALIIATIVTSLLTFMSFKWWVFKI
jgi:putative flippase GtrA